MTFLVCAIGDISEWRLHLVWLGARYFEVQLSYQERRKIEDWWLAKVPVVEMARVLKRHKSTVFREIKRNFWADDAFPRSMQVTLAWPRISGRSGVAPCNAN
ncbi:MAG: helix-turn-helix domain-containing protein [Planktotalea sp.]